MKLYDYYRSTASYRVRIALAMKDIEYENIAIHLLNQKHLELDYLNINPQGLVPTLSEQGHLISQSLAIIEYLDEIYPNPPLLPSTPLERAEVRSLAFIIACDIHPINNLRVLNYLRHEIKATEQQITQWYHHWLKIGFDALETKLAITSLNHQVCYGTEISIADLCLIPQVYNAQRFKFSMEKYPIINSINTHCLQLLSFQNAAPQNSSLE